MGRSRDKPSGQEERRAELAGMPSGMPDDVSGVRGDHSSPILP